MRISEYIILSVLIVFLFGCTNNAGQVNNKHELQENSGIKAIDKQLNITILLDLSDRIEPTKYPNSPEHYERDIEVVNYFTELFKKDMGSKGAFMAKGKMKVIFSPRPSDSEIDNIASQLSVDLSKTKSTKAKKEIFDKVSENFKKSLSRIYSKTIESKRYPGSDIWRFFKNDVKDYCLEEDNIYRNILVLITDGYLYHENSTDKNGNRSTFLSPKSIVTNGLRNINWKEKFNSQDYGYISTRDDLSNLDVLVLEINPLEKYKNDEDIIREYLGKWFTEMNVNSFKLYNSDLPQYTKAKIDKFFNQ